MIFLAFLNFEILLKIVKLQKLLTLLIIKYSSSNQVHYIGPLLFQVNLNDIIYKYVL